MEINNCNNFINDKRPVFKDDGCDYCAKIIDSWSVAARARCKAPYVPPTKPVQVTPKILTSTPTKVWKRQTTKTVSSSSAIRLSASDLVNVMLGRTLTYAGITSALDKAYPDHGVTLRMLQMRICGLMKSPHTHITRHERPVPEFTLHSVSERFYTDSKQRARTLAKGGADEN